MKKFAFAVITAALVLFAQAAWAVDRDNNPPGAAGGPGTNWENPPGAAGGPGASPNVRHAPPSHHHKHFCRKHPKHAGCVANPPGPAGGPGAGPIPPPPRKGDIDNNPPGAAGGPGTNWENPPGAKGGPGASPNRRPPKYK